MLARYGFALLFAAILVGGAAGCSHHETATASSATETFKVALLTPGPVSDAGWNAVAFDGLQLIKKTLGAHTAMVQTTSPADFEDAMRDFASRGFQVVFAHGFEYTDAALKVGKSFPKTYFIVTSGNRASENVASVTFKTEEAAYVEGVLAGKMTKSGVVGCVGGIELPAIHLAFNGFKKGFLSARPGGRMLMSFTGNFDDVGAAKEAALAQISQGADLLCQNADAAGLGVFQAAHQKKLYAFGANRNQNDIIPDTVIASAVTEIPRAFLDLATQIKAGNFHGGKIELGMKDGELNVVYNPALLPKIPPDALEAAKAAEADIIAGKIDVTRLASQ
jgi:basic membrane lipoprotein Med (substrate-binding protein (PBP1-ABC) superfamily)